MPNDDLAVLLAELTPAERRKWAVCVAERAVAALPASRRKAQLRWLLDRAFPPAGAALPPEQLRVCFHRAMTLAEHDLDTGETNWATWAALAVTWALATERDGTLSVGRAALVGSNAAILAASAAKASGGDWAQAHMAARAWQRERALAYSPANKAPATPPGVTGGLH